MTGFTINGGSSSASRLTTITVNFAGPVTAADFTTLGAIRLLRPETGTASAVVQTGTAGTSGLISVAQGSATSLILTFSNANGGSNFAGSSVQFGSLADGRWRLEHSQRQ